LTCKEVILNYLADYLDNVLGHGAAADLERHLANCEACMAYLNTYKRTRELIPGMVPAAMPDEMKARLRRFLLHRLARN
jgi:anti-sigma factor RsiW